MLICLYEEKAGKFGLSLLARQDFERGVAWYRKCIVGSDFLKAHDGKLRKRMVIKAFAVRRGI